MKKDQKENSVKKKFDFAEKVKENPNLVWGSIVVIALVIGYVLGGNVPLRPEPAGGTLDEQPLPESAQVISAEEADATTTSLGNRMVGATGSIDQMLENVQ